MRRIMLRLNVSLLAKFSVISLLLTAVIAIALAWGIQRQLEQNALRLAAESAAAQVSSILNPNLQPADLAGPLESVRYAQIDTLVRQNILHGHVVRVKIWGRDGLLLYSDDKDLVGRRYPVSDELQEALGGEIAMEVSSLTKQENVGERGRYSRLYEVYVPLQPMESADIPGAYEIYQDMAVLEPRIADMRRFVWASIGLGFLILYTSLFTLVRGASRQLIRRNEENTKLYEEAKQQLSQRRQAEEALRDSEERYALAVRGANDGLWDWNLKTNEFYFSARWKSMCGCGEDEIGNSPDEWFERVHPEDLHIVEANIAAHLQGRSLHFESEHRVRHKDGSWRWLLNRGLAVRDTDGKPYRMAGSATDITARKVAEERLAHDALHDALSGLPNRALFMDRLGQALQQVKRRGDRLSAVLFVDLDRFKVVNDSLGHTTGDQLLIAIAKRLEACLRPGDTVARLGGDEFAILLDGIGDVSDALRISDRIQKQLASPFSLSGHERSTTASIGIALLTKNYERPEDLLRDADTAMFRAKALGKARHMIFDARMHAKAMALLQLEADLRQAVERDEFRIHYQPIVSSADGQIVGAEALVRWQHPGRGLVSPMEFIPAAEETGLILPIGEWVLRTASSQARAWHEAGHPHLWVSVNISARQFQDENLPRLIKGILKETGLAADALRLEITESVAMTDLELSIETLNQLSAIGIQISLDDFGIGYSSMGYLKRFPLKSLKIDSSFIQDITSDSDNEGITTAIIAMAHSLQLVVVAEGVETEAQVAFLQSQQCDRMQGYLFGRPVPVEAFANLLLEGKNILAGSDGSLWPFMPEPAGHIKSAAGHLM